MSKYYCITSPLSGATSHQRPRGGEVSFFECLPNFERCYTNILELKYTRKENRHRHQCEGSEDGGDRPRRQKNRQQWVGEWVGEKDSKMVYLSGATWRRGEVRFLESLTDSASYLS
jgi:hypothetical protein